MDNNKKNFFACCKKSSLIKDLYFDFIQITRKLLNRSLKLSGPAANIIFYHRVANVDEDPHLLSICLDKFREQMSYLKNNYAIIPLKEMVEKIKNNSLRSDHIAVTFDDGYADNLYNALPILEELGIPVTIFVTAGKIGEDQLFDWDTDTKKKDRGRPLTCDELRKLSLSPLVEIAAHTINHPLLRCKTLDEQKYEIIEGRNILESILSKKISGFSYPIGSADAFSHETVALVKNAGYLYACTTHGGVIRRSSDLFILPRKLIRNCDLKEFIAKIEDRILIDVTSILNKINLSLKRSIHKAPLLCRIKFFLRRFLKNKFLYFLSSNIRPISDVYGMNRGEAIDRYYIESFLKNNSVFIKGDCLEILDNKYTQIFGREKVSKSDVLDIDRNNLNANIHDDLRTLETISNDQYDCIILTQVFQFINNLEEAVRQCKRVLKPGGALLVTLPSISRIDCVAALRGDYWRFTKASANYIFSKEFPQQNLEIDSYGNVLAGLAFWVGLAQEDMTAKKLDINDDNFPCLITVKAIK